MKIKNEEDVQQDAPDAIEETPALLADGISEPIPDASPAGNSAADSAATELGPISSGETAPKIVPIC
jgi:hypothetical protein